MHVLCHGMPRKIMDILTCRFAGDHYDRHTRLSLKGLLGVLVGSGFRVLNVELVGYPLFKPWLYQFSNKKVPWYGYF